MKNGKRITEKVPQRGHLGDYEERLAAPGLRYVTMIRHDGIEASIVLTNGAAHMDPNTAYGQYVKRKARFLGWFGTGECPCALVSNREISPDALMVEELRTAQPCAPGTYGGKAGLCPHAKAEQKAREAAHSDVQLEKEEKMKGKEDKILELLTQAVIDKKIAPEQNDPEPKPRRSKKDDE